MGNHSANLLEPLHRARHEDSPTPVEHGGGAGIDNQLFNLGLGAKAARLLMRYELEKLQ